VADWNRWQCRTLDTLPDVEKAAFLEHGTLACARKIDMVDHNQSKVRELQQPIALIKAVNNPKAEGNKEGDEGGLPNNIILCKGTKFRLTANLWTAAGLTNGAKGTVHSIIYKEGEKPPQLPVAVIGVFDKYNGAQFDWSADLHMPENAIPICPVSRQFFSGKKDCTRLMLPMILGYAMSIHRLQGDTMGKVILNPGVTEFALGLLLVGATRTKTFEGLAFTSPFPNFNRFAQIGKKKSLAARLEEERRLMALEEVTILELEQN
jgi:ATP-dependent DNA helicase PIF1